MKEFQLYSKENVFFENIFFYRQFIHTLNQSIYLSSKFIVKMLDFINIKEKKLTNFETKIKIYWKYKY